MVPRPCRRLATVPTLAVMALAGCATTRDFQDPKQRVRRGTAYTLQHGEVAVDVGAMGNGLSDAFGRVGVTAGVGKSAEFSTNVAHAALGMLNLNAKYNFVDGPAKAPRWSFAADAGVWYARPSWIWVLPDETRSTLGDDVQLVMVPVSLIATWAVHEKMDVSLGAGYTHAAFIGEVADEGIWYDGAAGLRTVALRPHINLYVENKAAIFIGAQQAVWASARTDFVSTAEVTPGVEVGVRSGEWFAVPVILGSHYYVGVETQVRRTHVRAFLMHGPVSRAVWGQKASFLPGVSLYWRW